MTETQVEGTSVQRRRRWSRAEKEQIVAAAMEPGRSASEVPGRLHTIQLFRWRQQLSVNAPITSARFSCIEGRFCRCRSHSASKR